MSCTVDGCDGKHDARGLCGVHYRRWKRHGDPNVLMIERNPKAKVAWLESASRVEHDECVDWPWGTAKGYGLYRPPGGGHLGAHAVVCEMVHGPCPPGMEAAHSCGRRLCASGRHLRWATPSENQADRIGHGTDLRGESVPTARLSDEIVRSIRRRYEAGGITQRELALAFGVAQPTISKILLRQRWAHVS